MLYLRERYDTDAVVVIAVVVVVVVVVVGRIKDELDAVTQK